MEPNMKALMMKLSASLCWLKGNITGVKRQNPPPALGEIAQVTNNFFTTNTPNMTTSDTPMINTSDTLLMNTPGTTTSDTPLNDTAHTTLVNSEL